VGKCKAKTTYRMLSPIVDDVDPYKLHHRDHDNSNSRNDFNGRRKFRFLTAHSQSFTYFGDVAKLH
jgi:hypothetical protein